MLEARLWMAGGTPEKEGTMEERAEHFVDQEEMSSKQVGTWVSREGSQDLP